MAPDLLAPSVLMLATAATALRAPAPCMMCSGGSSLPSSGGPMQLGDELIMKAKAHGTTARAVQRALRWGVATRRESGA